MEKNNPAFNFKEGSKPAHSLARNLKIEVVKRKYCSKTGSTAYVHSFYFDLA